MFCRDLGDLPNCHQSAEGNKGPKTRKGFKGSYKLLPKPTSPSANVSRIRFNLLQPRNKHFEKLIFSKTQLISKWKDTK